MNEKTEQKTETPATGKGRLERLVRHVNIAEISVDRYPMNPSTLTLVEYMQKGGDIPPIKIAKLKKGGFQIRDGRHRLLASKLLGRKTIKAKYSTLPMRCA